MASGHVNRIKRPNTWLHRPMLQNVKKALANPEPSTHGTKRKWRVVRSESAFGGIVLQNSKNGFQRFFREKGNQATIADQCVLKRATEVAGEFITSCCGPPHDCSIAALTARKICLQ